MLIVHRPQRLRLSHTACLEALERSGLPYTQLNFTAATGITGPADEELTSEFFTIGNRDAPTKLVITTSLHGAEGEAAEREIANLIEHHRELSSLLGPRIALVSAINLNPFGRAYDYRFDQLHRDPNRGNGAEEAPSCFYHEIDGIVNPESNPGFIDGLCHTLQLVRYSLQGADESGYSG